jgi:hypothetical protein
MCPMQLTRKKTAAVSIELWRAAWTGFRADLARDEIGSS